MARYKLYLSNNTTKTIEALTPRKAEYKYYGSKSHFNTEASVMKVKPIRKTTTKRKKPRTLNPFELRF